MNEAIINNIFIDKSKQILALTRLGRIGLESYRFSIEQPESELGGLFRSTSDLLPEQYKTKPLAEEYRGYKVVSFIDSMCFIGIISQFEDFLYQIMVAVLCATPKKINQAEIKIEHLLRYSSIESVVKSVAQRKVKEIMNNGAEIIQKELSKIISINWSDEDKKELWPVYVEAKARRNLGVHNNWVVDEKYQQLTQNLNFPKIENAALSVEVSYLLSTQEVICKIMDKIRQHCIQKFC